MVIKHKSDVCSDFKQAYNQSSGLEDRRASTSLPDRVCCGRRCQECDETAGNREGDGEEGSFRGQLNF